MTKSDTSYLFVTDAAGELHTPSKRIRPARVTTPTIAYTEPRPSLVISRPQPFRMV